QPSESSNDVSDPHFNEFLPVDHRRTVRPTHMEFGIPVDWKLLRPLTLDDGSIFFPNAQRELDQLLRRLIESKIPRDDHVSHALPVGDGSNEEQIDDPISFRIDVFVIEGEWNNDVVGQSVCRYLVRQPASNF